MKVIKLNVRQIITKQKTNIRYEPCTADILTWYADHIEVFMIYRKNAKDMIQGIKEEIKQKGYSKTEIKDMATLMEFLEAFLETKDKYVILG